jgi:hypothetical protein
MFVIPVAFAKHPEWKLAHSKEMLEYRNGHVICYITDFRISPLEGMIQIAIGPLKIINLLARNGRLLSYRSLARTWG